MEQSRIPAKLLVFPLPSRLVRENVVKTREIKEFLESNVAEGVKFVADATEMVYIDSAGIGFMVTMLKKAQSRGSNITIRNLQGDIFNLFRQSGLNKLFTIETPEETTTGREDLFDNAVDLDLDLKYELADGIGIFHLSGVMVAPHGVKKFKEQILLAMAETNRFLLDMENLTYLDSPAVGEIMMMNGLLKTSDGQIRVCCLNEIIGNLFRTLQLGKVIPIHETVKETLGNWRK